MSERDDGPKVVNLPAQDSFAGALSRMQRDMPKLLEYGSLVARVKRSYFLALVEQGFTPEQALELTKAPVAG